MKKIEILKRFLITKKQERLIQEYLVRLTEHNKQTNLVGKSTLTDPWKSHVLDSLQILAFIKKKNLSIIDLGTGAGLPGVPLSLVDFKNVTLVDSNGKKINFLRILKKEMDLGFKIILKRIENINNKKFDVVTSRALANLNKLLTYSQKFIKKNTVLIFLKGKTVNEEIEEAKKNWNFKYEIKQSLSDSRGCVLIIKEIKRKK